MFLIWGELLILKTYVSFTHSDYFEDYGQNQISALQFSPNGLYLAIVTDDRSVPSHESFYIDVITKMFLDKTISDTCLQGSSDLGARKERDGDADQSGPRL